MGRQIHFYMLPEDRKAFLQYVQEHDSTTVVARDSDMAKVEPVDSLEVDPVNTLCLWKTTLAPALERNWVPDPGYFRLDTLHKPILEFVPSFNATWEGKPTLGQGRLFGNFESYLGKPLESNNGTAG